MKRSRTETNPTPHHPTLAPTSCVNIDLEDDLTGDPEKVDPTPFALSVPKFWPPGATSWVWDHFGLLDGDRGVGVCLHCDAHIAYQQNPSNFAKHLKSVHRMRDVEIARKQRARQENRIDNYFPKKSELDAQSKQKRLRTIIARWVTRRGRPLSIADDEEFREIVAMLDPNLKVPTYKTVKTHIKSLYESTVSELQKTLANPNLYYSITADCWTSITLQSYLAVTIQFLDNSSEEPKITSKLLSIVPLHGSHTAAALGKSFTSILEEYGLKDRKPLMATMDGAANLKRMAFDLNWPLCHCFAHRLHLVVLEALRRMNETDLPTLPEWAFPSSRRNEEDFTEDVLAVGFGDESEGGLPSQYKWRLPQLEKLRRIIFKIKSSTAKLDTFMQQTKESSLKLILDVPTRWNSTYDMINRAIVQKGAVNHVISTYRDEFDDLTISDADWSSLKEVSNVLEPFYSATLELRSEQCCLADGVVIIQKLLNHLSHFTSNSASNSPGSKVCSPAVCNLFSCLSFSAVLYIEDFLLGAAWNSQQSICILNIIWT